MPSPAACATARSSVDLPVPGGPSSTTWMPAESAAASTSASRRRPTIRSSTRARSDRNSTSDDRGGAEGPLALISVFVNHHAPDVLAVEHVLEALVDVVQGVGVGDQLVELELARLVEADEVADVVHRVARAEQRALDGLLVERHHGAGELDGDLVRVRQAGDDRGAALADGVDGRADDLRVDDVDGDDRLVGADAARELLRDLVRLLGTRRAVRG